MVVGIVAVGSEYRYGTSPGAIWRFHGGVRCSWVKAEALIFGVIMGSPAWPPGCWCRFQFVLANGGSSCWTSLKYGDRSSLVCSIALWTLIGMGLGNLDQEQAVALVVGVIFGFGGADRLGCLLPEEWDQLLNLMPSGATNAMFEIHFARVVRRPSAIAMVASCSSSCDMVSGLPALAGETVCGTSRGRLSARTSLNGSTPSHMSLFHRSPGERWASRG